MKVSRGPATALVVVFLGLLLGALGTLIRLPYAVMSPGPISNVLGTTTHSDGTTSDLIVVTGHESVPDDRLARLHDGPDQRWPRVPRQRLGRHRRVDRPASGRLPGRRDLPAAADRGAGAAGEPGRDGRLPAGGHRGRAAGGGLPGDREGERRGGLARRSVGHDVPAGRRLRLHRRYRGDQRRRRPCRPSRRPRRAAPSTWSSSAAGPRSRSRPRPAPAGGRTVLGVVLKVDFQFPFSVKIDAGNVGGPSAGLMFSLGIYDKVTNGALTGGQNIAGTGTIDSSGKVGPIGGHPPEAGRGPAGRGELLPGPRRQLQRGPRRGAGRPPGDQDRDLRRRPGRGREDRGRRPEEPPGLLTRIPNASGPADPHTVRLPACLTRIPCASRPA